MRHLLEVVADEQELAPTQSTELDVPVGPGRPLAERRRQGQLDVGAVLGRRQVRERDAVREPGRRDGRDLERQPGLAHAAGAEERDQPRPAAQQALDVVHEVVAPDQLVQRDRHGRQPRSRRTGAQGRILLEDPVLQPDQVGVGRQSGLLADHVPGARERREGVALATVPVEREHEVAPEPLAQGVGAGELLELRQDRQVVAGSQLAVHAQLERVDAVERQAVRHVGRERQVREVRDRFSPPEAQGIPQLLAGRVGTTGLERPPGVGDLAGEAGRVDLPVGRVEHVAGGRRRDPPTGPPTCAVRFEGASQGGHVDAQRPGSTLRWRVGPDRGREHVDGDDAARAQGQDRQHAGLLGPAGDDRGARVVVDLERTEEADLHPGSARPVPAEQVLNIMGPRCPHVHQRPEEPP